MKPDSILSGDFSEQRWVVQISKNFDDDTSDDVPVCVFSVPKSTTHFKPEAYVPLAIALGPYHHFQTHLYQMERYKVAAVKAILTPDQVLSFESLVISKLIEKEPMVRACYHKYMNLDVDTLAWILAIDGLFLIGLFQHHVDIAPFMPKKLINDGVLYRDVMVLENQIPLCLLNEIWKALHLSLAFHDHNGDRELIFMLREFCEAQSPLKLAKDLNNGIEKGLHLLDLMYHLIVNNQESSQPSQVLLQPKIKEDGKKLIAVDQDNLTENIGEALEMGLHLGVGKKADRPIKVIKNIPWQKISNLLGVKLREQNKEGNLDPPRVTELEIPSASSLSRYGQINISQITGGIRDIKFDKKKATLYLPVITLNDYSEVVLRNLIAYEVATSSSRPELAEYIDLMSGIVDKEEDVKLLRANSIIKGNMNDKDVADLFNGMNKNSVSITSNTTIEQLNEYYNNRAMIKAWRFIKKDLLCSRKVATIVLTVLVCLLMIIYSFCEVYDCPRLFYR